MMCFCHYYIQKAQSNKRAIRKKQFYRKNQDFIPIKFDVFIKKKNENQYFFLSSIFRHNQTLKKILIKKEMKN